MGDLPHVGKNGFYRKPIRPLKLRAPLNSTVVDLHFCVCCGIAVAECLSEGLFYKDTKWQHKRAPL